MRDNWARIRTLILNSVTIATLLIFAFFLLVAVWFWMEEVTLDHPGPAIGMLLLAIAVLSLGLVGWWIDNLAAKYRLLQQRNSNLPQVNGLDIVVKYWLNFRNNLDRHDSIILYEQILSTQNIFNKDGVARLSFIKSFPGNKPENGVFLVQPENRQVQVLKFDRIENMRAERNCFARCVSGTISGHVPGKPLAYWPEEADWETFSGDKRGAIVYDLAQLNQEYPLTSGNVDMVRTFGQHYVEADTPIVVKTLKQTVAVLDQWWGKPGNQGCPYKNDSQTPVGLYDEYVRLKDNLSQMEQGLQMLLDATNLKLNHTADGSQFAIKRLNLLNEKWFCHPLIWVRQVFGSPNTFSSRFASLDEPGARRDSIVHGDFHAGNILIDGHQHQTRIWLIDFPHTHVGPTVQDIARLEADIKFGLFPSDLLGEAQNLEVILAFEEAILGSGTRQDLSLLDKQLPKEIDGLSKTDALELDKVWHALAELRHPVRSRYLAQNDARPYYLALLHATLPTLYYRDRSPWQKLYAFISAALLCQRLGG